MGCFITQVKQPHPLLLIIFPTSSLEKSSLDKTKLQSYYLEWNNNSLLPTDDIVKFSLLVI